MYRSGLEVVGWLGTLLYLVAYALLALRWIPAARLYFGLNIVAALFIVAVSLLKHTYQSVAINVLWGLISFSAIVHYRIHFIPIRPPLFRLLGGMGIAVAFSLLLLGQNSSSISLFGWISVFAFILPYLFFVNGRIEILEFHMWNFIAATSILPKLVVDRNWQVFALEAFWALSALSGMARHYWKREDARRDGKNENEDLKKKDVERHSDPDP